MVSLLSSEVRDNPVQSFVVVELNKVIFIKLIWYPREVTEVLITDGSLHYS